jgi:hypothetical protein
MNSLVGSEIEALTTLARRREPVRNVTIVTNVTLPSYEPSKSSRFLPGIPDLVCTNS